MRHLKSGFLLLVDLTHLESMDASCAPELGAIMDLCSAKEVSSVIRVIPEPHKDIGLAIISRFHYNPPAKTQTYENLAEAINSLLTGPLKASS
jgi:anti-anti-sigma regulatory factor